MHKKEQNVTLALPDSGEEIVLNIIHAERLLSMGPHNSGGWQIAEKDQDKYEFDLENGIRIKQAEGDSEEAEQDEHDKQGDSATEETKISY